MTQQKVEEPGISDLSESKCVVLVSDALPTGLAVNAASVVSLTLGTRVEGLVGPDVKDADGHVHAGLTVLPVPVLKAPPERIAEVARAVTDAEDVIVVGFTATAQAARTYDEYTDSIGAIPTAALEYAGLGLCGPRKTVQRLTGAFALMR